MKKALKALAWILGAVVLFIGVAALYMQLTGLPRYAKPTLQLKVEATPERVARGWRRCCA
jgi:hypothetical protein